MNSKELKTKITYVIQRRLPPCSKGLGEVRVWYDTLDLYTSLDPAIERCVQRGKARNRYAVGYRIIKRMDEIVYPIKKGE